MRLLCFKNINKNKNLDGFKSDKSRGHSAEEPFCNLLEKGDL